MRKWHMGKTACLLGAAGIWVGTSTNALSNIVVSGSSGTFAASATFYVVPGTGGYAGQNLLQIVLANTSSYDVTSPTGGGGILTAVFFDLSPTTSLTPISASLGGSTVFFGPTGGGNVGGEWAYKANLNSAPGNAGLGVS